MGLEDAGVELMGWEEALEINHGDYAYGPEGGMIEREKDGSYTITRGDIASAGYDWSDVQRKGLLQEQIPEVLAELGMPLENWSYE